MQRLSVRDCKHFNVVPDQPAVKEVAKLNVSDSVTKVKEAHVIVIVEAEEPKEETAVKVKEVEAGTANNKKKSEIIKPKAIVKVKSANDNYAELKSESIVIIAPIVIRIESAEGGTPSICFDDILETVWKEVSRGVKGGG